MPKQQQMKSALKSNSQKGTPRQKAGSYNLIKGTKVQLSPFCNLYKAMDRDSRQIWHAKVIDNRSIDEYALSEALDYNIQVLKNCQQLQNVVYVKEMFLKAQSTFIIQEQYDYTLVQKVNQSFPVFSGEIQDVLNDIVSGLVEIYNEKYVHRSLRPEHIVCVDDVWKIQSFVLNSEMFAVQSEFCWHSRFASPEDRSKSQELSDRQIDEQLVWALGIIGLYMILGPNFQYEKITKDTFIPWIKVKQNSSQSLYRFLVKALKVDFKERMRLRELFQNQLFSHLDLSKSQPFQSYSKFYGQESDSSAKKKLLALPLSPENEKKMNILQNDIQRFMYFGLVEKFVQQLPYKNNFDISLIRYLSFKISYQNLLKLKNEIMIWKRENSSLLGSTRLKEIEQDLNMSINKVKQSKINYSKNVRGIEMGKSEIDEIRRSFEIVDEKIPYADVVDLYMKLAGSIYTLVSKECHSNPTESKQRTVCYYSLGAYLVYFYELQSFKNTKIYQKNNILSLSKLIEEANITFLIKLTQNLIKQQFALNNQI